MFVNLKNYIRAAIIGSALVGTACQSVHASETAILTVHLLGVQNGGGPLYVSVQKRSDFKQERGTAGGIYENVIGGNISYTYVDVPIGEYGVMIWHDTDNYGQFSKDEKTYMPLDGWGASGPELQGEPKFDDVKITVDSFGTELTIKMHYP